MPFQAGFRLSGSCSPRPAPLKYCEPMAAKTGGGVKPRWALAIHVGCGAACGRRGSQRARRHGAARAPPRTPPAAGRGRRDQHPRPRVAGDDKGGPGNSPGRGHSGAPRFAARGHRVGGREHREGGRVPAAGSSAEPGPLPPYPRPLPQVLEAGGSALDAVTAAVVALEEDPRFNAGRGSVLTLQASGPRAGTGARRRGSSAREGPGEGRGARLLAGGAGLCAAAARDLPGCRGHAPPNACHSPGAASAATAAAALRTTSGKRPNAPKPRPPTPPTPPGPARAGGVGHDQRRTLRRGRAADARCGWPPRARPRPRLAPAALPRPLASSGAPRAAQPPFPSPPQCATPCWPPAP